MPFVWDAGGAELSDGQHEVRDRLAAGRAGRASSWPTCCPRGLYDKSQLERDGTQVENQFKGGRLAVWMGGPWVLGSVERADDENWVPAARKNLGHRADAGRPGGARATRSSAART